jgi:hypothetical protein
VTAIASRDQAGAVLFIDLGAIVANWRLLRRRVTPSECAAVVKADAYGLGAAEVAPALHIDTGMARLGLPPEELSQLGDDPSRFDGIDLRCIMSHLACADTPEHPLNARQRDTFRAALAILPEGAGLVCQLLGNFSRRRLLGRPCAPRHCPVWRGARARAAEPDAGRRAPGRQDPAGPSN